MEAPKGMIQRWLDVLANHSFTVEHRAGVKHGNADGLSRAPHLQDKGDTDVSAGECNSLSINQLWAMTLDDVELGEDEEFVWSPAQIVEAQEKDDELTLLRHHIRHHTKPTQEEISALSRTGKVWAGLFNDLKIDRHGLLRYTNREVEGSAEQSLILLPRNLWHRAIQLAHNDAAHMGAAATVERARKQFFFPGMLKEALEVIQGCQDCQRRDNAPKDQRHTLKSHLDGYPFQKLSIDFVGPLPRSKKGNEYLLTIRDTFTRWIEAFPLKRATAEAVVRILTTEIFPRFGVCEQIHTDRGTQFTGTLMTEAAKMLGIRLTHTPAYNPKSNPVERAHRDLGRALKALVKDNPATWEEHLPHVLFVMRTAVCRSTGFAPYQLLFGRDATTSLDLIFGPPPHTASEHVSEMEYVNTLRNRIESAHTWARENMFETVRRQRKAYFKDKPAAFLPGELVWLFSPVNLRGQRQKLQTHWTGPWTVQRQANELMYEIQPDAKWTHCKKALTVSIDRLKRFYVDECPDANFSRPPGPHHRLELTGDEFAEAIENEPSNQDWTQEADAGHPPAAPLHVPDGPLPPPLDIPAGAPNAGDALGLPDDEQEQEEEEGGDGVDPVPARQRIELWQGIYQDERNPHGPRLDRMRRENELLREQEGQRLEAQQLARRARHLERQARAGERAARDLEARGAGPHMFTIKEEREENDGGREREREEKKEETEKCKINK